MYITGLVINLLKHIIENKSLGSTKLTLYKQLKIGVS